MKFLMSILLCLIFVSCSHHGHMKKMDSDSDGKVTKEEWTKGHDQMFSKMDKNSDGVVDADEANMKDCGKKSSCGDKHAEKKSCSDHKEKCEKCADSSKKEACDKCAKD